MYDPIENALLYMLKYSIIVILFFIYVGIVIIIENGLICLIEKEILSYKFKMTNMGLIYMLIFFFSNYLSYELVLIILMLFTL